MEPIEKEIYRKQVIRDKKFAKLNFNTLFSCIEQFLKFVDKNIEVNKNCKELLFDNTYYKFILSFY